MAKGKNMLGWVKKISNVYKKKKWSKTETQGPISIGGMAETSSTSGSQTANTTEFKPLPIIGHLSLRSQFAVGFGLLGINFAFVIFCTWFYYSGFGQVASAINITTNLQTQSQRIAKTAQRALIGDEKTFESLALSKNVFDKELVAVKKAVESWDQSQTLILEREIEDVETQWKRSSKVVDKILSQKEQIISNAANAKEVSFQAEKMLDYLEQLSALMVQSGAGVKDQSIVNYGIFISQRLARNATELLLSEKVATEYVAKISSDVETLNKIVSSLNVLNFGTGLSYSQRNNVASKGSSGYVSQLISSTQLYFGEFQKSITKMSLNAQSITENRQKGVGLIEASDRLSDALLKVEKEYEKKRTQVNLRAYVAAFFGFLTIVSFGIVVLVNLKEVRRQAIESKQEKVSTDGAIMRLLDELGDLADGNLTVRATVSEEVTGAIADSVNFAISQLAELVGAIQIASTQIQEATFKAKSTSKKLLKINEQQSKDIADTGRAVLQIAEAIEEVSRRMGDSKRVAELSVSNANRGSEAVSNSITGIRNIQSNVEETGKRIKRLTEQSQQISEIVDLIADISERTSVLAINATVQATKAGAAGKGFKVVADAVQDLANQASDATRRIGALINAIQTDIIGAGSAMDKTTEEAQKGAQLAEATGEALAEISDVSFALSDIVAEINDQVGQSAKAAAQVSQTMKKVLDSVNESSSTTKDTDTAVEEVNDLAIKLKESVSGFKI